MNKNMLLAGCITATLLVGMSFASYTNALYNSCFQNIFSLGLCPFNVVLYLPYIIMFVAFFITYRRMKPPSYALSFLSAAIVSYLVFVLILQTSGGVLNVAVQSYLTTSVLLTVAWIAAFAYEINR